MGPLCRPIGAARTRYQHTKTHMDDPNTKCSSSFITSTNFSETAQRHNFEAGWLVREPWRTDQATKHFRRMVAEELFIVLPPENQL